MRELLANELPFIAGADNINVYFGYYAFTMFYSACAAELMFSSYCGYQLAIATGVMSGPAGAVAGLAFIPAVLLIESRLSK